MQARMFVELLLVQAERLQDRMRSPGRDAHGGVNIRF